MNARHFHIGETIEQLHGAFYYVHDIDGVFQYISDSMCFILGYSKDEFLNHYSTYFTDDPVNRTAAEFSDKSCEGIQQQPYEINICHKNGDSIWLQVSEVPQFDSLGNVKSINGVAVDITAHKLNIFRLLQRLNEERQQHEQSISIHDQTMQQTTRIRKLWKNTQKALVDAKGRYKSIIHDAFDAIIISDLKGTIKEANPASAQIFGWRVTDLKRQKIIGIIPFLDYDVICDDCMNHVNETEGIHKTKGKIYLEVIPTKITHSRESYYSITVRDITQRKETELLSIESQKGLEKRVAQRSYELEQSNRELMELSSKLEELNRLDELCSIYNRRAFNQDYTKEWARSCRAGSSIAVIMIDIDYFKLYNDKYGHQEGDGCLQKVSSALANSVHRVADTVCRYGGEEFIVLLPETTENGAVHVGNSVRLAVESLELQHEESKVSQYVTVSVGVAVTIPTKDGRQDDLVKKADHALYEAKKLRNHVVLAC